MKSVLDNFQQEVTTWSWRICILNLEFCSTQILLIGEDFDVQHVPRQKCLNFGNFYATDFDGQEICTENFDCRMLRDANKNTLPLSPLDSLFFIVSHGNDILKEIMYALPYTFFKQFLCQSIASCERTFSKLRLILSYLRYLMNQDRLWNLVVLGVGKETLETISRWWCHWSVFSSEDPKNKSLVKRFLSMLLVM
jgi:hypothetical protein